MCEACVLRDAFKFKIPEVSPFVLFCSYSAAMLLVQVNRKRQKSETSSWLRILEETLAIKHRRWRASGMCFYSLNSVCRMLMREIEAFLEFLEAQEVINVY
jgi:hypothetical protein